MRLQGLSEHRADGPSHSAPLLPPGFSGPLARAASARPPPSRPTPGQLLLAAFPGSSLPLLVLADASHQNGDPGGFSSGLLGRRIQWTVGVWRQAVCGSRSCVPTGGSSLYSEGLRLLPHPYPLPAILPFPKVGITRDDPRGMFGPSSGFSESLHQWTPQSCSSFNVPWGLAPSPNCFS